MANTVPLSLIWVPITTPTAALDLNQLGNIIAKQLSGSLDQAGVSFFLSGTTNPTTDQGLFYNTVAKMFFIWDTVSAGYVPMGGSKIGDVIPTFLSGDNVTQGLVVLDGRSIVSIPGLSTRQQTALTTLFGTSLPTIGFLGAMTGIPTNGSIGGITVPTDTVANLADAVTQLRNKTESLRDAVAGVGSPSTEIYAKVFCGYP